MATQSTSESTSPRGHFSLAIIIGLVFLVILLIISLVVRHNNSNKVTASHSTAVVEITANGFQPSTLNVKVGTVVKWENRDTSPHKVGSNPYPADTSVPGLHSKAIAPGGTYSFTTTKTATIHYHDDTKPTWNGTIEVTN